MIVQASVARCAIEVKIADVEKKAATAEQP